MKLFFWIVPHFNFADTREKKSQTTAFLVCFRWQMTKWPTNRVSTLYRHNHHQEDCECYTLGPFFFFVAHYNT